MGILRRANWSQRSSCYKKGGQPCFKTRKKSFSRSDLHTFIIKSMNAIPACRMCGVRHISEYSQTISELRSTKTKLPKRRRRSSTISLLLLLVLGCYYLKMTGTWMLRYRWCPEVSLSVVSHSHKIFEQGLGVFKQGRVGMLRFSAVSLESSNMHSKSNICNRHRSWLVPAGMYVHTTTAILLYYYTATLYIVLTPIKGRRYFLLTLRNIIFEPGGAVCKIWAKPPLAPLQTSMWWSRSSLSL